jgi:hypothetical protein
MEKKKIIKRKLIFFMVALIFSGITAFPLKLEIKLLSKIQHFFPSFISKWISHLEEVINNSPLEMMYGTDWLAFAHIIIALFFIPVYQKPIQYQLNLKIGMLACILVFPLAFICGPIRDIPFFHQLIDCSFGLFGFIYLKNINQNIESLKLKGEISTNNN